jgi:hypothetical protein
MNCYEIPLIKNFIIKTFDTDDNLKLAMSSPRSDFKEDVAPSIYELVDVNLFKYKYPRSLEDVQNVIISICVNLDARPTMRKGSLYIYVYSHVDLMNTDYGITRIDYIISKIESLLNNSNVKGVLSEINFVETRELAPVNNWIVNAMEYKFTSYNSSCVQLDESYD